MSGGQDVFCFFLLELYLFVSLLHIERLLLFGDSSNEFFGAMKGVFFLLFLGADIFVV